MINKIYIIHGWTYTIKPWDKVVEILKNNGIEVIQLEVPGLTSPSDAVWTIDKYVDWLDKSLAGDNSPVVLGHSNGGRIALNLASRKPDRFKHLILLDSAGVYDGTFKTTTKRRVFKGLSVIFSPLKKNPFLRKVVYKLSGSGDYNRAPENMKTTLNNMLASDKLLNLSKVKTPTTIIWGREDKITPLWEAHVLEKKIIGSQLRVYDKWTHAPYIHYPDEVADAILGVLRSLK